MAIAPALFLVRYYYLEDKKKKEPKELIINIFIIGVFSTCPVIIIELILSHVNNIFKGIPLLYCFFRAFVVAALCEEYIKLRVVKRYAYSNIHFDEVMDGIVYAVVASLGFACMENILYVMRTNLTVALIRAFTAVPMHAICAGIMGYYIGKAKFSLSKKSEKELLKKGFWKAVGIHGLYDFFLFITPSMAAGFSLLAFGLVIVTYHNLKDKIKIAIKEDVRAGRV